MVEPPGRKEETKEIKRKMIKERILFNRKEKELNSKDKNHWKE